MRSASWTTAPSATEELVRDTTLARLRDTLRSFGSAHGFLIPYLCGCGNEGCAQARVETTSLLTMLRAVATEWTAEPDPSAEPLLQTRLASFARAFDLLECPCDDPRCPTVSAWRLDARALLRVVADMWHGRAGNRVGVADTAVEGWADHVSLVLSEGSDRYARNLGALTALSLRLDPVDAHTFRRVLPAAEGQESAWLGEARAMAAEAMATWLPTPDPVREARRVLDGALALAWEAGWTTSEAAVFERAAADACSGVLTLGFVHPSVTKRLFAPFATVVSLADLEGAGAALLQADERIAIAG
jgi:hypothetical protein